MIVSALVLAALAGSATAQQKITIGGTPNSGPATAMVADVEGIFQKHGLEATYTLITINPSIPPALLARATSLGLAAVTLPAASLPPRGDPAMAPAEATPAESP